MKTWEDLGTERDGTTGGREVRDIFVPSQTIINFNSLVADPRPPDFDQVRLHTTEFDT